MENQHTSVATTARTVACLLLLLGSAAIGAAQTGITLHVVVEDASRAPAPGVTVHLVETTTTSPRTAVTDALGRASFDNVPRGTYNVRAELDGFEPATTTVTIDTQAPDTLRLRLRTPTLNEQVTVEGTEQGSAVSPDRNTDAAEFDSDQLRELPTDDSQSLLSLLETFADPAVMRGGGLSIVVDGMDSTALGVPVSSVRRLALNRNPYSAEFRRAGKARAEIVTQRGSRNYFHGGGAYFLRNSALDARNAYATTKPDTDRQLFELSFSGPLPGRGMSMFVSGDRFSEQDAAFVNAQTPAGPLMDTAPTSETSTNVLGRFDLRRGRGGARELSVRYALSDTDETNRGVGGLRLPAQGFASTERDDRVRVSLHHVKSSRFVHDFNIGVGRERDTAGVLATAPSVIVHGAFSDGPSQVFEDARSTSLEVQDTIVLSRQAHTLRVGGKLRRQQTDVTDAPNFGGTFEFADLDEYAARRPMLFRINRGDPTAAFTEYEGSAFVQDTIGRGMVSLSMGLRYDWESWVHDRDNLSPRLAVAVAPGDQRTVFRAGAGIFYDTLPDLAVVRSLVYDGLGAEQILILRPGFPDPFAAGRASSIPPSLVRLSPTLESPYTAQANFAVERELWRRTYLTVDFTALRGVHLFRIRDVNAPAPGSATRPQVGFGRIVDVESSGISRSQALAVTFRGRIDEFKGTAQYTWSSAKDSASDWFTPPANSLDLSSEFGPADFDRRHRLALAGAYEWPEHAWRLGVRALLSSGAPFDITTGADDNRDGVAADRPPGVTRNAGRGPRSAQIDIRVSKLLLLPKFFPERESDELSDNFELNVDVFNLFNHVNRTTPVGVLSSPLFGQSTGATRPRTLQLSVRYRF